jgi:dihydrolipoamide dehydrogenase
MLPGILPGADRDLVGVLSKRIDKKFESVVVNTTVAAIEERDGRIAVTFEGDGAGEGTYDNVLVSVGRKPNSEGFGLENTKATVDDRGFIEVNAQMRTAEPSIYAIGDVVGEPMLAHKASHEGRTAVEAIAGHKVAFEPNAIPAVIFTDPEIAWAGLTATEAKEKGTEVEVAKFPWAASGRALTLERTDGLTKLVVEPKTGRILGVGIVGVGAGDMIAEGALAIEMGANATDLKLTIHPHPTLSETLMEAAEVFFGQSTHVYRPRRK